MIKHGSAPYLECSSKGEKRLSAFYAKPSNCMCQSIESLYQAAKIFADGSSNLDWRQAKGRHAVNQAECQALYSHLWDIYINENPDLADMIVNASGLSDQFGQPGHACQATELWRIRARLRKERGLAD